MSEAKVIPLKKLQDAAPKPQEPASETDDTFDQLIAKNKANEERLKKERLQANKNVLREYRIK